jgi:hypothetical protein
MHEDVDQFISHNVVHARGRASDFVDHNVAAVVGPEHLAVDPHR